VTGDPTALPLAASLAPLAGLAAAASRRETARTSETLADLASGPLAPAPSYGDAGPVRADQLPRLTWTDELPVVRPAPAAPSGDTPNVEPAGGESDAWQASQQSASAAAEEPQAAPADAPNPQGGSEQPVRTGSAEAAGLAEPSQWHAGESAAPGGFTWHDPTLAAEPQDDEESYIQPIDVFGAPQPLAPAREAEPLTRPLPETTRPLLADASAAVPAVSPEVSPDVSPRGSVWDHISQVLAGRPVAPLPDDPESAEGGADDASQGASQPAD
jgi:hypothetical protein